MKKHCVLLICLFLSLMVYRATTVVAGDSLAVYESQWQKTKGKHFIVYNPKNMDSWKARQILSAAEQYYVSIASQIGYTRYDQFWTWEQRVKIFIFENKENFVTAENILKKFNLSV